MEENCKKLTKISEQLINYPLYEERSQQEYGLRTRLCKAKKR